MGGETDPRYREPDGRKIVYSSLNPLKLLRQANKFTYILLLVLAVLLSLILLIVRSILRKHRRKSRKHTA